MISEEREYLWGERSLAVSGEEQREPIRAKRRRGIEEKRRKGEIDYQGGLERETNDTSNMKWSRIG